MIFIGLTLAAALLLLLGTRRYLKKHPNNPAADIVYPHNVPPLDMRYAQPPLELNESVVMQLSLQALFWRRVAFVRRHGHENLILEMNEHFDSVDWLEDKNTGELKALNRNLVDFWRPVFVEVEDHRG